MSELLDIVGLHRLLVELVGNRQTCTLLGRSDENHALMIGLRGGEICLFVYAGKQGLPAVAAARGISTLTVRRDDIGVPFGRSDMPPTAQILQALAIPPPAHAAAPAATTVGRVVPIARPSALQSPPPPPRAAPPPVRPAAPPAATHFMDTVRVVAIAELATQSLRPDAASSPQVPPSRLTHPGLPAQPPDVARPVPVPHPTATSVARSAGYRGSQMPEFEDSQWATLFDRPEPASSGAGFVTDFATDPPQRGEASAHDVAAEPHAVEVRVAEHNHRAWQLFRKGEYEAALAELDAAKALAPDNPTLLANIKRIERRAHAQPEPEHNPWAMP